MNPFLSMEQHKDAFTKNDQKIYEAILQNPEQITYMSTSKFAEKCKVSQPAVTRFVKNIGYAKFQDFRSDVTMWVAQQNVPKDSNRLYYFERMEQLLSEAEKVLTDDLLRDLAKYILSFDRIFAVGMGKSMHPALLLQSLTRKEDLFVHTCDLEMLHEYADHLKKTDVLVIFSVSAQPDILKRIEGTEGKVLLITTTAPKRSNKYIDRVVTLPYLPPDPEASSISPILFNMFVELLVSYMEKELNQ